ncbi:hypothetical protein P7K49_027323, partial [Saguinus oedipus]
HPLHPPGIPGARRWSLLTPAQRRARPPEPVTRAPISAPRRPGTLREKSTTPNPLETASSSSCRRRGPRLRQDLRAPAVFYAVQRDPAPTGGDLERGECRGAQSAGWARLPGEGPRPPLGCLVPLWDGELFPASGPDTGSLPGQRFARVFRRRSLNHLVLLGLLSVSRDILLLEDSARPGTLKIC